MPFLTALVIKPWWVLAMSMVVPVLVAHGTLVDDRATSKALRVGTAVLALAGVPAMIALTR